MQKKCPRCKELKDYKDFYPSKLTKSGIYSCCKKCQNQRDKEQREKRKAEGPTKILTSKQCFKCKDIKPVSQFPIKRDASDGYVSYCKACWNLYVKAAQKKKLDKLSAK